LTFYVVKYKCYYSHTMSTCIKILDTFFATAPAVDDLSETAERVDAICTLLETASDVEDKDFDLIYYFYNNNCLLGDIYALKTDANVKKHLERTYLILSFSDLLNSPISRITFKDFNVGEDHNHIKYRLRRLKQRVERRPSSLGDFVVETIFTHSLNTDSLPTILKDKVLQEY